MTDKQKQAIKVINELRFQPSDQISEDNYFLLLDFIMQEQSQVQYIPYYPWNTFQTDWKDNDPHPYRVTCGGSATVNSNK